MSHPARGGWIEISCARMLPQSQGRPTPHGVGGLKSRCVLPRHAGDKSHPARGGWIEMHMGLMNRLVPTPSHPARGGWIEIPHRAPRKEAPQSHPARGGWIEIQRRTDAGAGYQRPTPHGVGGLKYLELWLRAGAAGPTPHGVGGLKSRPGRQRL